MSELSPLAALALDVLLARGVQPHVVSDMWMTREVPARLADPVMIGALARLTPREGSAVGQLRARARALLRTRGDRGWGALCATIDDAAATWLAVREDSHPIHMRQWPEQTVRAMTMIMQLQGESAWFADVVDAFETLWCHDDQELARWLTGRPWSRGDRVAQVLFEAGLTGKRPHELWRLLQKAKRHREARHRLTQEHVDYLMKRRMKEWYKSLRMLRMYGTVRAD